MKTLREVRRAAAITQKKAAEQLGVSLRSYITYENDPDKEQTIKYRYMLEKLQEIYRIDEEHGILSVSQIQERVGNVCAKHPVEYCYLFGSYARGCAAEDSDVDLLIGSDLTGLQFYGLVEELREELQKKVDVLNMQQLPQNEKLLNDVLREGIRIYRKA